MSSGRRDRQGATTLFSAKDITPFPKMPEIPISFTGLDLAEAVPKWAGRAYIEHNALESCIRCDRQQREMTAFRVIVNLGTLRLAAGFLIAEPDCPMTLGPGCRRCRDCGRKKRSMALPEDTKCGAKSSFGNGGRALTKSESERPTGSEDPNE